MKRILIFSLAYYPHVGGAEVAVKEITDRILDIEFFMITNRFSAADQPVEKLGNVTVHRIGSGGSYLSKILFIPRAALHARTLHKENKFDGMWAMMSYMVLPVLLSRLPLPYALTLQEGDTYSHMFSRLRILPFLPLINRGFRGATVVQAISTYLGGWARTRGFEGALEIIPNGVSVKDFSREHTPSVLNEIKDKLGKKMGDVFLITTSRLVKKNAVDTVIEALPMIPPHVRFLILGTGPEKLNLQKRAAALGVDSRVQFLGQVSHEELPAHLSASDIFIRPSRSEGMGNSFIEAMAAGLPVIATQEGGIADFLFDEKRNPEKPVTGWAVDKNSPTQIAAAVAEVMSRPEKVRAVVAVAKQLVAEKYDWSLISKDMREKVFAKIV